MSYPCTMKQCKEKEIPCQPPLCKPVDCRIPVCDEFKPEELLYKGGAIDAVVTIQSEFILIGADAPENITGITPIAYNVRRDVILEGNGFLIEGKYIVTAAQLVLTPPSLSAVANRYPFFNKQDLAQPTTVIQNELIQASRIFVTVNNVNNEGKDYVYEAKLKGVYGAGDIAVLYIDHDSCWNNTNPRIQKCHPHLSFGTSRSSIKGEKVYLLGDSGSQGVLNQSVFESGVLIDNMYADPSGNFLQELLLVSTDASSLVGLPILNAQGLVIGMKTGARNNNTVSIGPTEFFMRPVILALIQGICDPCNCHLELVNDPIGPFYRYKTAYLGAAYDIAKGVDFDYTVDYTNDPVYGGDVRVRLDENGNFLNSPQWKEIIGMRVLGLAGLNPGDVANGAIDNGLIYVPGGTGPAPLPTLPPSSLIGKILPGDIISHINGVKLGDSENQVAPGLVTSRLCPGQMVEICFRRGGNAKNNEFNDESGNYTSLYAEHITLGELPKVLDYPYYSSIFPNMILHFDFAGVWPDALASNPEIQIFEGAKFKPSL